jgi:hypothetical protein
MTMDFPAVVHLLAVAGFLWLIWLAVQWVHGRSRLIGTIFAAAIVVRLTSGIVLFLISFFQLPIATSLQAGGGFWKLAADAQGYYGLAADAVRTGIPIQDAAVPSPFFIKTLAWWMWLVGVNPLAGMFLNSCLYAGAVAAVVSCFRPVDDWRRDLPCIAGVTAYSFSPVLLIHATQPLKDDLFAVLIVLACLAVLSFRRLVYGGAGLAWTFVGMAALSLAIFGSAGIRWYYALLLWGATAASLLACGFWGRTTRFAAYAGGTMVALMFAWLGLWAGSGPYYKAIHEYVVLGPSHLSIVVQLSRRGFLMTGGGTNVVVPLRKDPEVGKAHELALVKEQLHSEAAFRDQAPAPPTRGVLPQPAVPQLPKTAPPPPTPLTPVQLEQTQAARAIPVTVTDHFKVAETGLAFVFLPSALAGRLLGVELSGGRGLLPIAELDTLFQAVTMLLVAGLLWRGRRTVGDRLPVLFFGIIVSIASALLLSYVVTNFGTMWRLRPLVTVPFWMTTLALSPGGWQVQDDQRR